MWKRKLSFLITALLLVVPIHALSASEITSSKDDIIIDDHQAPRTLTKGLSKKASNSQLSFALAGSGTLYFYYFGLMNQLIEMGAVDPATTRFGGISGGTITTFLTCAGMPMTEVYQIMKTIYTNCRNNPASCILNTAVQFKRFLYDKAFNDNPLLYEQCGKGRLRIGITGLRPYDTTFDSKFSVTPENYKSAADLEEAVMASTYYRCMVGPYSYVSFRGKPVIDGGYQVDLPEICPKGSRNCIKVSAFQVGPNVTANPVSGPSCPISPPIEFAESPLPLWPQPAQKASWKLPDSCTYKYETFRDVTGMDILPGKYNKIKWTKAQWQSLAGCVPSDDDMQYMWDMGVLDAQSWYEEYLRNNP